MEYLVPVLITIGVIALYLATYALNKNTPAPIEGYEKIDEATCSACSNYSCGIKQQFTEDR